MIEAFFPKDPAFERPILTPLCSAKQGYLFFGCAPSFGEVMGAVATCSPERSRSKDMKQMNSAGVRSVTGAQRFLCRDCNWRKGDARRISETSRAKRFSGSPIGSVRCATDGNTVVKRAGSAGKWANFMSPGTKR